MTVTLCSNYASPCCPDRRGQQPYAAQSPPFSKAAILRCVKIKNKTQWMGSLRRDCRFAGCKLNGFTFIALQGEWWPVFPASWHRLLPGLFGVWSHEECWWVRQHWGSEIGWTWTFIWLTCKSQCIWKSQALTLTLHIALESPHYREDDNIGGQTTLTKMNN